jgi:hypothetical protein
VKDPTPPCILSGIFAHDNWWHYGASLALGRLYAGRGDVQRADAYSAKPARRCLPYPSAELSPASRMSRGNICSFRKFSKKWGATQRLARLSPNSRNGERRRNRKLSLIDRT